MYAYVCIYIYIYIKRDRYYACVRMCIHIYKCI